MMLDHLGSVFRHPSTGVVIKVVTALLMIGLVRRIGKPMLATAVFSGLFLVADLTGNLAAVASLVRAMIVFVVAGFVFWLVDRVENVPVFLAIALAGVLLLLYFS